MPPFAEDDENAFITNDEISFLTASKDRTYFDETTGRVVFSTEQSPGPSSFFEKLVDFNLKICCNFCGIRSIDAIQSSQHNGKFLIVTDYKTVKETEEEIHGNEGPNVFGMNDDDVNNVEDVDVDDVRQAVNEGDGNKEKNAAKYEIIRDIMRKREENRRRIMERDAAAFNRPKGGDQIDISSKNNNYQSNNKDKENTTTASSIKIGHQLSNNTESKCKTESSFVMNAINNSDADEIVNDATKRDMSTKNKRRKNIAKRLAKSLSLKNAKVKYRSDDRRNLHSPSQKMRSKSKRMKKSLFVLKEKRWR